MKPLAALYKYSQRNRQFPRNCQVPRWPHQPGWPAVLRSSPGLTRAQCATLAEPTADISHHFIGQSVASSSLPSCFTLHLPSTHFLGSKRISRRLLSISTSFKGFLGLGPNLSQLTTLCDGSPAQVDGQL